MSEYQARKNLVKASRAYQRVDDTGLENFTLLDRGYSDDLSEAIETVDAALNEDRSPVSLEVALHKTGKIYEESSDWEEPAEYILQAMKELKDMVDFDSPDSLDFYLSS